MDYGQGFQRALGTQQEIQVPGQLFLLAYGYLTVGLSKKEIWIAEHHLAPVNLSNEC